MVRAPGSCESVDSGPQGPTVSMTGSLEAQMMSRRRSLLTFGALLTAVMLLVPAAGLAQTGTTDTVDPIVVPPANAVVSSVRVLPFADKFDSLQVAWVEPTEALVTADGGPLNGYRIYYAERTATEAELTNLLNADSKDVGVGVSGEITGLKPGKTYLVRVAPKNEIGVGTANQASDTVLGTVTMPDAPDRVTGVVAEPGDMMLMIEWREPFAGHSSLTIKAYHVFVRTSKTADKDAGTWRDVGPVTTNMATASNLTNGTMYDIEVSAENSADVAGDRSVMIMATPSADAMPPDDEDDEDMPMETPALPIAGILALGAGLLAAGRRRLRL